MFLHPWFLLLLALVPFAGWRMWLARNRSAVLFSSAATEWTASPTWRQRLLWLPPVLALASLTLMIIALARPRFGRDQTIINSEGIAIELVVDRSSSMRALDFQIDQLHVDRLTAIKNVAEQFVLGDSVADRKNDKRGRSDDGEPLPGRASDLIGLIVFAGYADAVTPLTLDHAFLMDELNRTQIVNERDEDGTAIGDAISLAVDKLNRIDQRQPNAVKSKVAILLTDGENTAGEIEPKQAAELAQKMGIKVYTIGVGTKGLAPYPVRRSRSGQIIVQPVEVNIDETALRAIAKTTGAKYFRATDTESLETIYAEIDRLEKTEVETQQFVDYREIAVQWTRLFGHNFPPILLIAFGMLAASALLRNTILRQLT